MSKNTSANTMRYQDVNMGEEGVMKMGSAGMDIQECAYIIRQEGVKKEITVIFTTVGKDTVIRKKDQTFLVSSLWHEIFTQDMI